MALLERTHISGYDTADATPVVLYALPIPEGCVFALTAFLVAHEDGNGHSVAWRIGGVWKRDSGNPSPVELAAAKTDEWRSPNTATWGVTFESDNAGSMVVMAKGPAGVTVHWEGWIEGVQIL